MAHAEFTEIAISEVVIETHRRRSFLDTLEAGLGLLVETGAIGFLLAAATAVSLAVMLLRRRRHSRTYSARVQALAGLVALIGAAIQSLPNYNLPVMSNLIYLSLALIIAQSGPTTAGGVIPGQEES